MLLRLIIKNFLSFDDEVQFDMFPNMKRTQMADHIYTDLCDVPVLKQTAIYGQNGAGKSNLVKALEFMRAFGEDAIGYSKISLSESNMPVDGHIEKCIVIHFNIISEALKEEVNNSDFFDYLKINIELRKSFSLHIKIF